MPDRIITLLNQELKISKIPDTSLNGVQVEGTRSIKKAALAVDASLRAFQAAEGAKADLLIVHHGIIWGQAERLVGQHYQRIQALIRSGIWLYAAHLPLDMHPRLGNNAVMARRLGLSQLVPFGDYHGLKIGFGGVLKKKLRLSQIEARLKKITGHASMVFPFGTSDIQKVAILSGGGGFAVEEAVQKKYDLYITGELPHTHFYPAHEGKLNVIAGGHYATETLGVKAIGEFIRQKAGIKTVFLDFPTGL